MKKKEFTTLVRTKRKEKKISLRELARTLNLSAAMLSSFENCKANLSYDNIVKLCNVLNLDCIDEALAAWGFVAKDIECKLLNDTKLYEKIRNE